MDLLFPDISEYYMIHNLLPNRLGKNYLQPHCRQLLNYLFSLWKPIDQTAHMFHSHLDIKSHYSYC